MPGPSPTSAASIKRYLHRCLGQVVKALPLLHASEKNSHQVVISLASLMEQRECTQRVDKDGAVLLIPFPDMKEMLIAKLSCDVDRKIELLQESLQMLKEQKDFLAQSKEELWALLSNHADGPEFEILEHGTPTTPPLEMMLASLDTAERHVRELHCAREFFLQDLAEQSVVTSDNLANLWADNASLLMAVLEDCQRHVKYFLEEKI